MKPMPANRNATRPSLSIATDYSWISSLVLGCLVLLAACDASPPAGAPSPEQDRGVQAQSAQDFKRKQMAFLNRIREADPQQRTIDRALLNEQNELGLILDRSVELQHIPDLMRTMLAQMASEFPNQDLTVLAYAPSNPPRKIGTAHFDARTRAMSYVPEQ
jgi:hypothetical protein